MNIRTAVAIAATLFILGLIGCSTNDTYRAVDLREAPQVHMYKLLTWQ